VAACLSATGAKAAINAEAGAAASTQIEELIVTAEKRTQSVQDVPMAVTALTSEKRDLLGLKTTQDVAALTPGLAYNSSSDRLTVRGVGRLSNNSASEGGVAIYEDGVYISTVYPLTHSSMFIDRTEVLRGPQGTLYGRNAIGGTINIIAKRPTDDFTGELRTSVGSYDTQSYEAAVSGPIAGDVRGRLAASYWNQHDGFYTNISGGPSEGNRGEISYIEGQLDGKFGNKVDWWIKAADWQLHSLGYGGGGRQGVTFGFPDVATALQSGTTPSSSFANFNRTSPLAVTVCDRCFDSDSPNSIHLRIDDFIAHVTFHADNFDLKYIGGAYTYLYRQQTDIDGTHNSAPFLVMPGQAGVPGGPAGAANQVIPTAGTLFYPQLVNHYEEHPTWFSNEINIASTGKGRVQWIAGLYQYQTAGEYNPTNATSPDDARFAAPLLPNGSAAAPDPQRTYALATSDVHSQSYAVFGQVDWQATDTVKLTGGLRYTYDKKDVTEGARVICFMSASSACVPAVERATGMPIDITSLAVGTAAILDPSVVASSIHIDPTNGIKYRELKNHWDGVGGTLGLTWQPEHGTLVYANYTRGYKAGGFNSATSTLSQFVTTKKETVNAYEIGVKKSVASSLQVNGAVFYYDYNDLQVLQSQYDPNLNANVSLYANLPKTRIYGLELESIWQPIERLQVNANYSYLNTEIQQACCYQDKNDPLGLQPGVVRGAGSSATAVFQDVKGAHLPASTPNRVTVNVNYKLDVGGGTLRPSLTYVWRDATYYDIFNRYYNRAKAFDQWDANLIWSPANKHITVLGYLRNIADAKGQLIVQGTRLTNTGPRTSFVDENVSYILPRTYGVELQYRF